MTYRQRYNAATIAHRRLHLIAVDVLKFTVQLIGRAAKAATATTVAVTGAIVVIHIAPMTEAGGGHQMRGAAAHLTVQRIGKVPESIHFAHQLAVIVENQPNAMALLRDDGRLDHLGRGGGHLGVDPFLPIDLHRLGATDCAARFVGGHGFAHISCPHIGCVARLMDGVAVDGADQCRGFRRCSGGH